MIYGPTSANWDIDLGTVIVQDWYYKDAFEVWFKERQTPGVPADTGLINGKNKNGSLGEYTEFTFVPGIRYRMRLINTSTDQHFKFSIDNHVMTVMSSDFVPIQPYPQTVLDIAIGMPNDLVFAYLPGQRYDIVFKANQIIDNYWMRAVPATNCSANLNPNGIRAIVRYVGANSTSDPTSTPFNISSTECKDETGLVPIVPKSVGSLTTGEEVSLAVIKNNTVKFVLNDSSLFIDWDNPTLLMVDSMNMTFPPEYNVISISGTSDTVLSPR